MEPLTLLCRQRREDAATARLPEPAVRNAAMVSVSASANLTLTC